MESTFSYDRVALAIIAIYYCCFCFTLAPVIACSLHERNLLLDFKAAVVDEDNTLSSWHGFDCCTWSGVGCNFSTGHVSALDLSGYNLQGHIDSSLFELAQLEHLDLSYNLFHGNLTTHIGKLKRLTFLDLSDHFNGLSLSLESLSHLVSLEYLSLCGVDISVSKEEAEAFRSLSNLEQLHMRRCGLKGPIPKFLLNLTSLLHLDLSANSLSAKIPAWFENVSSRLLSLDLSFNKNLRIDVSSAIWNMSSLRDLVLSGSRIEGEIPSAIGNLMSLQSLDLSKTRIVGEIPSAMWNLSFLRILDLSDNVIEGGIPSGIKNLSSLQSLDLSNTRIQGEIPSAIGNLMSLQSLDLANNCVEGEIPLSMFNLSKLVRLDLSYSKLTGVIPSSLRSLSSLVYLDLSYNQLNGKIPSTVSDHHSLKYLWLNSNNFSGSFSFSLFQNLTRLENLSLSNNNLIVKTKSSWIPQFKKLVFLDLCFCNLDRIPLFLVTQYDLGYLDLSNNNIATNIPSWIWDLPSLYNLNLSTNQLRGSLPSRLTSRALLYVDLYDNRLEGALPLPPAGIYVLQLSMNQFNGSIPTDFSEQLQHTYFISLSSNNLSGPITNTICSTYLKVLDLSNNALTGMIPQRLTKNCSFLGVLDLAENHLEGKMPVDWGNLKELHTLKLNGNQLSGAIPSSIVKCQSLQVLDLGNNNLEGSIPHWIGNLSELHVLMLRSNKFQGNIPAQLIDLQNLQILDLSSNHLSGPIPSNLANLLAMVNASQSNPNHLEEQLLDHGKPQHISGVTPYTNKITMTWKGWDVEFAQILFILKCIDFSNNNLSGIIPSNMGSLQGLIALNLSGNHLSGRIPKTLGHMEQLESLDLSLNKLNGKIPLELQSLSYLEFLNLSYNMLYGRVPHGQLLTFVESSYLGNPALTEIPFSNTTTCSNSSGFDSCTSIETSGKEENISDAEMIEWTVGLGLSYGLGFSIVVGILTFNKRVRKRAFDLFDDVILAVDKCMFVRKL